jgi:hypothetical protein
MYTIFGYNDLCEDFSYKFDSFVGAVRAFRELCFMNIVFLMREQPGTCLHVK